MTTPKLSALLIAGLTAACQSASSAPSAAVAGTLETAIVSPQAAPRAAEASGDTAAKPAPSFAAWREELRAEAEARGVSAATFARAFAHVSPNPAVLKADRHQPEFTRPIWDYLASAVSARRIAAGQRHLAAHRPLLEAAAARYGVAPEYVVAIWGIESDFGANTGAYSVIEALATLAYAGQRQAAFRAYLLDALLILEEGDVEPTRMRGSWAGAMGQTQFMPTAFRERAVDFDGDGRRDIWTSLADVFGSTANYLAAAGWRPGQSWGDEVRLPPDFRYELADPEIRQTVGAWQALGVRLVDAAAAPPPDRPASLLLPAGHRGPAFLVYDNFRVLLRYNNATSYALAVGHLADRIGGGGPIAASWPVEEQPLSRSQQVELQRLLAARGFDPGPIDGMIGPMTRQAIRRFQAALGHPADGYATLDLLSRLRAAQS